MKADYPLKIKAAPPSSGSQAWHRPRQREAVCFALRFLLCFSCGQGLPPPFPNFWHEVWEPSGDHSPALWEAGRGLAVERIWVSLSQYNQSRGWLCGADGCDQEGQRGEIQATLCSSLECPGVRLQLQGGRSAFSWFALVTIRLSQSPVTRARRWAQVSQRLAVSFVALITSWGLTVPY